MRTISVILDETICAMEHWLVDEALHPTKATGARFRHLQDLHEYYEFPDPPQVIAIRDLQRQAYELSIELKQQGL